MTNTEINEAVARKLGVWKQSGHSMGQSGFSVDYDPGVKDYAGSIQAAFEIIQQFEAEKMTLRWDQFDKEWNFCIRDVIGEADTAPLAICRAFLKLEDK